MVGFSLDHEIIDYLDEIVNILKNEKNKPDANRSKVLNTILKFIKQRNNPRKVAEVVKGLL